MAYTHRQLVAKEYMEQYEEACRRVRQCEEQLERENITVDAIRSASDNDGMPHGTNVGRPTEEKAIRLVDKSINLFEARREAREVQRKVFDAAFSIGGVESDVLIERYVKLKGWESIYSVVNYSESQTHRYHKAGLDKIADMLGVE